MVLGTGQVIARIHDKIVRVKTFAPEEDLNYQVRDKIIERCRKLYYKPVKEVRQAIRRRDERWRTPIGNYGVSNNFVETKENVCGDLTFEEL